MSEAPAHVRAASPLLRLISVLGTLLGAILLVGGVFLAVIGGRADTTLVLFGSEFSSTSVGVTMAFIGVVLVGVTFRRILVSVDYLSGLPGPGVRAKPRRKKKDGSEATPDNRRSV